MKNTITQLTPDTLSQIQDVVMLELIKRGYHVDITISPKIVVDVLKLKVSSTAFQTTPVLFRKLHITDSGSRVWQRDDSGMSLGWAIEVSVRWEAFSGGENGTQLFAISGFADVETSRVAGVQINYG